MKAMETSCERRIGTQGYLAYSFCTCSLCSVDVSVRCKKCKGDKVVKEKTRQEIFVERGMSDGQRIIMAGAGDQEVRVFIP